MSISPPDFQTLGQNKCLVSPTVDSETEEFRKYLESGGVLDVMTKILKEIYEQENKPSNPLAYFTESLGAVSYHAREIAALKDEIKDLKSVIDNLENENKTLREKTE